jgi:hypothetical protein
VKIVIAGREYDPVSYKSAELLHLMELKQQSKAVIPGGIGMKLLDSIARRAKALKAKVEAALAAGEDIPDDEVDPDDGILFAAVGIFLTRRASGEQITFLDACRVRLEDIEYITGPEDDEDIEDTKEPPDPTGAPSTTSESPSHAG